MPGFILNALPAPPEKFPRMEYRVEDKENGWLYLDWHGPDKNAWKTILESIKGLPFRRFDGPTKRWVVPSTRAMRDWLNAAGFTNETVVKPPVKYQLPDRPLVPPLDKSRVVDGLFPFQVDFLRFSQGRARLCLFDEQGTGKTIQALAWARYYSNFPLLIIVNAPTKVQWKHQFEKWIPYVKVDILSGKTPYRLEAGKSYIINWDILTDWQENLVSHKFRAVVADEVQAVGDKSSKRTKAFMAVAKSAPRMLAMSGTPARSRPAQLWPLLNCINEHVFPNFYQFAEYFGGPKDTPWGRQYTGATHTKELHDLLVKIALRRTKAQVLQDLPDKTVDIVPMDIDSTAMDKYIAEEAGISAEDKGASLQAKLVSLARTAYAVKQASVKEWVKDYLSSGSKLVIFAWHRSVVEDLAEYLKDYNPAVLYGGIGEKAREESKGKFIKDETCRVMVANITSGGVGIDGLQDVCSACCFVECSMTPADHWQAEDRLHRTGQKSAVNVYYLIAPGTVDDDAVSLLDRKTKNLSKVIDGHAPAETQLLQSLMRRRGV